jgi:hypothetical protein
MAFWWFQFEDYAHCTLTFDDQQQPPGITTWTRAGTFRLPINAIRILTTDEHHILKGCSAVVKMNKIEYDFTSMKVSSAGHIRLSSISTSRYPLHKISWRIWDLQMLPAMQTDMSATSASSHQAATEN